MNPTSYEFTTFRPVDNWIGGVFRPAAEGRRLEVINPRHGRTCTTVADSTAADVAAAVEVAAGAFPAWKATPIKERVQVLYRLKGLMHDHLEELSWIVSHENGKTYDEAVASVAKGIECVEFGISLPNMIAGGTLDVSRGVNCSLFHEPLGVCAGVTPFNFPVMVPLWMLPQALVAGNTFVLKPSEQVPVSVTRLAELFHEAGLPPGVLNLVHGGREAVEALADHPGIAAMGFVGSTRVAKSVYARGARQGRRMLCLGGAKNHMIVVPDADPTVTCANAVASFTGCAGQRCMAASVMVAVGDVDHIIEGMKEIARAMELGRDMGAIINAASVERITRYIDEAEAAGATVLVDGRGARVEGAPGYWVGPTILDHVRPDMPAACEEIFGPVLSIVRVASLDEAIALENASPYGNAASIFTTSGAAARKLIEGANAGMNGINIGVPVPREPFSFGGWNDSKFGHGDITGFDGFRFWTRPRKVTAKWAVQPDMTWMS